MISLCRIRIRIKMSWILTLLANHNQQMFLLNFCRNIDAKFFLLPDKIQCYGSGMSIPDPKLFHPGSGIRFFATLILVLLSLYLQEELRLSGPRLFQVLR
jgi:hypothetical protein